MTETPRVTVKLDGLKDALQALESLPRALAKSVIQKAAIDALEPMRKEAANLAPVDPRKRDLKENIIVSTRRKVAHKSKFLKEMVSSVVVYLGPATKGGAYPEAIMQEFGTKPHIIRPRRGKRGLMVKMPDGSFRKPVDIDHPGNAPHPYMRPAWDLHADRVASALIENIGKHFNAAAERLAKRQARKASGT